MTFAELTIEERIKVTEMIQKIIGKKEDAITEKMTRSDRIKARENYNKLFDKLTKVWMKGGDKALALTYTWEGSHCHGVTPDGKSWVFEMNSFGWTQRSHHCGSLYIEGVGNLFTSGTIARAFERILEN